MGTRLQRAERISFVCAPGTGVAGSHGGDPR